MVSLGTLVVVANVKEVDVLSTVALALAILSFAAQLVVSMLQTQSSAKLNASTESALAEMRATTDSLLTNQRDQFNRVLAALINGIPAAVDDAVGSSESGDSDDANGDGDSSSSIALQANLKNRLLELWSTSTPLDVKWTSSLPENKSFPSDLDEYPTEDVGKVAAAKIRSLDPLAVPALIRVAEKIRSAEKRGRPPVAIYTVSKSGKPGPSFQAILDAGLVERDIAVDADGLQRIHYRLTEDGRNAARILLPRKTKPRWLTEFQRDNPPNP